MKKDKLEKILLRYSGAAAAVLGAQSANAQIIYTDLQPDVVLDQNGESYDFNIDMDTSGVMDYRITQLVDSVQSIPGGGSANVSGSIIEARGTAANQVLGLDYGNYNYPFRLDVGEVIGEERTFKGLNSNTKVGYLGVLVNDTTYPNSQFNTGVTDAFIGLKFQGDLNDTIRTFYGWIHVDVAADLESITIKGFGYESTPQKEIQAGHGSPIGIEEVEYQLPEITQRGHYLDVSLPETFNPEAEIRFFDLGGKVVSTVSISERKESISLEHFPKGVLIATIRSNGAETSRKVLVY